MQRIVLLAAMPVSYKGGVSNILFKIAQCVGLARVNISGLKSHRAT